MIFLDGVGLGENNSETNPFVSAHLPTLESFTNGETWLKTTGKQETSRAIFIPTDPRLGVKGRPQSGTGQATIVTGRNISQLIGEHYGPKPSEKTRALLDEDNFFKQVVNAGKTASLLEAYPPQWHEVIERGKRLPSSYQYAARSAGVPFLGIDDLRAGTAISGDWTAEAWKTQLSYDDIPILTPYESGQRLVKLSREVDFAFFPHWLTDIAGHRGPMKRAIELLETFNQVMAGVLDEWDDNEGLIIITSDHGNIEEIGNRKHTENDVPTVVIGEKRHQFAEGVSDLSHLVGGMSQLLL